MNLLLLLTALLASLTGSGSGDGAVRRVQGVAVVQAAQVAQAAVHPSRRTVLSVSVPRLAETRQAATPIDDSAPLVATYLPFERRLE